jgi:hypothetical protein
MKSNKESSRAPSAKNIVIAAISVVVVVIAVAFFRRSTPQAPVNGFRSVSQPASVDPGQVGVKTGSTGSPKSLVGTEKSSLVGPASRAIKNTIARTPNHNLAESDILQLELLFGDAFDEFLQERDRIIQTKIVDGGFIEIQVPSCPSVAEYYFRGLISKIKTSAISNKDSAVAVAKIAFGGYSEEFGRNAVTYTVKPDQGNDLRYTYTREVAMLSGPNGKLTGTGFTSGVIDLSLDPDPTFVTALQRAKKQKQGNQK